MPIAEVRFTRFGLVPAFDPAVRGMTEPIVTGKRFYPAAPPPV